MQHTKIDKEFVDNFITEVESIGMTQEDAHDITYAPSLAKMGRDEQPWKYSYQPESVKTAYSIFGEDKCNIFAIINNVYLKFVLGNYAYQDEEIIETFEKFKQNKAKIKLYFEFLLEEIKEKHTSSSHIDAKAQIFSKDKSQRIEYTKNIEALAKIFESNGIGDIQDQILRPLFSIIISLSRFDAFWTDDITISKSIILQIFQQKRIEPPKISLYFNIMCKKYGIKGIEKQIRDSIKIVSEERTDRNLITTIRIIDEWISDPSSKTSTEVYDELNRIKGSDSAIEFFKPHTEFVYRGIAVEKENLNRIFTEEQIAEIIKNGTASFNVDFMFQPKSGYPALSWTRSYKVAQSFSRNSSERQYSIIFTAKISDNSDKFFDLTKHYLHGGERTMSKEQEVISIDNIKISTVTAILNRDKEN
jgi:hypothetical protein